MSRFGRLLRILLLIAALAAPLFGCQAIFGEYQINDAAFAGSGSGQTGPILLKPTEGLVTTEWGSQATFTIVLDHPPTANVTVTLFSTDTSEGTISPSSVTFSKDDWRAPQVITVTGVDDDLDDFSQKYRIVTERAKSKDPSFNDKDPIDIELVNTDNETAGITVVPTAGLVTTEAGGQDTFTVVLNSRPEKDVAISLASDTPSEGTVSPTSLLFTPLNWMAPQLVTVTGVDDQEKDPAHAYNITVTPTSESQNYASLNGSAPQVAVINQDDESAGVRFDLVSGIDPIDPNKLRTTEKKDSDSATFSVVLNARPSADVTMAVTVSDDGDEATVSPGSLTFTPLDWNAPQIVTVTGKDDDIVDGDQPYQITLGVPEGGDTDYAKLPETTVPAFNVDDDKPGVRLTLVTGIDPRDNAKLVTNESGSTASFSLVLNSQPSEPVTIGLASSNTAEGTVSPSSLVFTKLNWNAPQDVSVKGVNDPIADGDVTFFIRTGAATSDDPGYALLDPPDVQVTNQDDDIPNLRVALGDGQDPNNPGKLVTEENGRTATFSVALTSQPTADVKVPLISSKTGEGMLSKNSLVFTPNNYGAPQFVTITGVADEIVDGNQPYVIAIGTATSDDPGYNGKFNPQVQVINRDIDRAGVIVDPTSGLSTGEDGRAASFTIHLQSKPTADVSIALRSSNVLEGKPNVGSVKFTAQNWDTAQTITVTGQPDQVQDGNQPYKIIIDPPTSADGNYQGKFDPSDVSLTNNDIDTAGFTVMPLTGLITTEGGGKATFTVALTSKPTSMNTSTPTVKIQLSTSKSAEASVSPASMTFTAVNWKTPQTVTVTGRDDKIVDGNQPYLIILGTASSEDGNYNNRKPPDVSARNDDDDIPELDIVAPSNLKTFEKNAGTASFTVALRSEPTFAVSIGVSSSNMGEGTVSPATLVFSTSNWATPQTVTITGVQDDVVDGPQTYQVKLANAVSQDPNYHGKFGTQLDVQNVDDDLVGFVVSAGSMLQTTETGEKATFSVTLRSKPVGTASVTLPVSSSNVKEGTVAPASLVFTGSNWNQAHTVTVTGVDDPIADGDVSYQIVFGTSSSTDPAYNNLTPPAAVTLTNVDEDHVGVLVLSTSCATTPDTTATFTIQLTSQPSADVSISLSSDTPTVGTVSPGSVTFTPASGAGGWDTPQTVTVTGVSDGSISTTTPYTIVTSSASAPGETTGYDGYSNVSDVACTNTTP